MHSSLLPWGSVPEPRRQSLMCVDAFGDAAKGLDASFRRLLACEPITFAAKPRSLPSSVVYLFSDTQPIYAGRSNTFGSRLGQHCRAGSQANQASLAFRMACEEVGHIRQRYKQGSSFKDALRDVAGLADAFSAMKERLRFAEVRYVAEPDQVRQALLEMYTALALGLRHDFGTH